VVLVSDYNFNNPRHGVPYGAGLLQAKGSPADTVKEKLRLAEYLELLIESTDQGIYGIDRRGRCTFVNPSAARMLGYHPDELPGESMHRLVHHTRSDGSPYPEEECPIYRAFEENRGTRVDSEVLWRRDETPIPVEYSSYPIVRDGVVEGAIVTFVDITERRRAEEKLKESEERFRSLVQNASDIIIILEADGTIRYVSPAIARVLGLQPEDVVGKNAVAFVDPIDRTEARRMFAEAKKEPGIRPPVEFRLRHEDGTWRHLEINRSNLLDDLAVGGIVFNLRDVTDRKVAEEQLRRRAFHDLLGGLQSRYLLLDTVQERGNRQDRINEGVPLCEFGEILPGESCELPGKSWSEGKLLCDAHARQSELQDRIDLLRGVITSLELCLDNVAVRRDANFVRLLKAEVAHATAELELAQGELQRAKG
jgi:PAS domain S-box-containing protein